MCGVAWQAPPSLSWTLNNDETEVTILSGEGPFDDFLCLTSPPLPPEPPPSPPPKPPSPPPPPPPPPSSPLPPASPATAFQPCQCTEIRSERRCVCLQSNTALNDQSLARMKAYYELVESRSNAKEEL